MKALDELPLSTLLRFGLTGFVSITLYGILPIAVFAPGSIPVLAGVGGAVGTLAFALTTGFIIDGLKPNQLSPGYQGRKTHFMQAIASALGVSLQQAPLLFVKAAQLERSKGLGHIDFIHSRWVAFDIFAKLFLGAGCLWMMVAIALWALHEKPGERLILSMLAASCVLVALRLFQTSRQECQRAEKLYVEFCTRHAIEIIRI